MNPDLLRYPIGKFIPPVSITERDRSRFINEIETLPEELITAVDGLSEQQLNAQYRPGGWTLRQVIHHIPESHLNSYIRFKWALTESKPVIKAYDEKAWANLEDARKAPIDLSLALLTAIHGRWVWFLKNMTPDDWKNSFMHPETNKVIPLDLNLALYAWHGKHHLGHILSLKTEKGW